MIKVIYLDTATNVKQESLFQTESELELHQAQHPKLYDNSYVEIIPAVYDVVPEQIIPAKDAVYDIIPEQIIPGKDAVYEVTPDQIIPAKDAVLDENGETLEAAIPEQIITGISVLIEEAVPAQVIPEVRTLVEDAVPEQIIPEVKTLISEEQQIQHENTMQVTISDVTAYFLQQKNIDKYLKRIQFGQVLMAELAAMNKSSLESGALTSDQVLAMKQALAPIKDFVSEGSLGFALSALNSDSVLPLTLKGYFATKISNYLAGES